jgi:hypothetical protein
MTTSRFFKSFDPPLQLDWVYVDASHTYDGCMADLEGSLTIVKPGGIIFGDDYGNKAAVKRAVDDFVAKHDLPLNNFHSNQFEIQLP